MMPERIRRTTLCCRPRRALHSVRSESYCCAGSGLVCEGRMTPWRRAGQGGGGPRAQMRGKKGGWNGGLQMAMWLCSCR